MNARSYKFVIVCDLLKSVNATIEVDGEYSGSILCSSKVLMVIAASLRKQGIDVAVVRGV